VPSFSEESESFTCCLTPIKPERSTGKKVILPEKFLFPFSVQRTKLSDLISIGSSDMACRARALAAAGSPAKHLFGLKRAGQSVVPKPLAPQPAFQRCDLMPQPGPETLCSTPRRYPFKLKDGCPDQVGAPVLCGRASGAESPKLFSFGGYVMSKVNEPGASCEP
jgi:hypothetical protein